MYSVGYSQLLTNTCKCIHIYRHTYVNKHTHTHTYIYIHTRTHTHTHTHTHPHTHTHTHTYSHVHIHTHASTYMQMHTHTNTHIDVDIISCFHCVCHMLQVIKVSVFCRLSKCQYVASSNSVSVLYTLPFVSVLKALTMSVCCTH